MKAKDLDPKFFPRQEVVAEYEKYGQQYESHGPDRLWSTHFYPKVTGNAKLRNQDIETKIQAMYRHKDKDGEWLTYHVTLYGNDWEGNRISFPYTEAR
jgi:hypothetical protein